MFFFKCYGYHRDLHVLTHSFPTRRSSDLRSTQAFMLLSRSASSKRLTGGSLLSSRVSAGASFAPSAASAVAALSVLSPVHADSASATASERSRRSEEHTSELQSLMRISYAVFCLQKKHNRIEQERTT